MTTRTQHIRQISLFTMNGLADPRLLPDPAEATDHANDLNNITGEPKELFISIRKIIQQLRISIYRTKENMQ